MTARQALSAALTQELSEVNSRLQRSVVVVHNGQRGAGAGVVWRAGGYIVTNHHVIAHGKIAHQPGGWRPAPCPVGSARPRDRPGPAAG